MRAHQAGLFLVCSRLCPLDAQRLLGLCGLAPGRPRRERKSLSWKPWQGFHTFPRSGSGRQSPPSPPRSALRATMTSSGSGWHPLAKPGTLDGFPGPPAKGSAGQSPSSPTRYARGAPTHVPSGAFPAARAELGFSQSAPAKRRSSPVLAASSKTSISRSSNSAVLDVASLRSSSARGRPGIPPRRRGRAKRAGWRVAGRGRGRVPRATALARQRGGTGARGWLARTRSLSTAVLPVA